MSVIAEIRHRSVDCTVHHCYRAASASCLRLGSQSRFQFDGSLGMSRSSLRFRYSRQQVSFFSALSA
jgi:hypothetical protein